MTYGMLWRHSKSMWIHPKRPLAMAVGHGRVDVIAPNGESRQEDNRVKALVPQQLYNLHHACVLARIAAVISAVDRWGHVVCWRRCWGS